MLIYAILDRATLFVLRFRLAHEQAVFDERLRAGRARMADLLRLDSVAADLMRFRRYLETTSAARR